MSSLGVKRKPKNIIEVFTYDITTLFLEEDYEELSSEEDNNGLVVDFEKNLPWKEHGLFDKVIFRMFNAKNNIDGSSHINLRFPCSSEQLEKGKAVEFTNLLVDVFGDDDAKRSKWITEDDKKYSNGTLNRFWTIGEEKDIYSVELQVSESNGLLLRILFFNHLMNTLNKAMV